MFVTNMRDWTVLETSERAVAIKERKRTVSDNVSQCPGQPQALSKKYQFIFVLYCVVSSGVSTV